MTQEEKAKAYDEALEIAKKNYDVAQDLCNESQIGVECFKNILTNIFPELKESEDEKIRKWLIDWAKAVNWSEQFTVTKEQVLAWLEKQKKPEDMVYITELKVWPANSATTANRQLYNRAILAILSNYVEKYPDTRFGQMLCNLDVNPHFDQESRETYWNLSKTINKQNHE